MVELGTYSLFLALAFSLLAAGVSIAAALAGRSEWARTGERGVYAVFALLTLAILALEVALLGDRFDLAFVAQVSSREQHWAFKIPALWVAYCRSNLSRILRVPQDGCCFLMPKMVRSIWKGSLLACRYGARLRSFKASSPQSL